MRIVQRAVAEQVPAINAWSSQDFAAFVDNYSKASTLGQPDVNQSDPEISPSTILEALKPLAAKTKDWWQFSQFVASVADEAGDSVTAVALYQQAYSLIDAKDVELEPTAKRIKSRISAILSQSLPPSPAVAAEAGSTAATASSLTRCNSMSTSGLPQSSGVAVIGVLGLIPNKLDEYQVLGHLGPEAVGTPGVDSLVSAIRSIAPQARLTFTADRIADPISASYAIQQMVANHVDVLLLAIKLTRVLNEPAIVSTLKSAAEAGVVVVVPAGDEGAFIEPPLANKPIAARVLIVSAVDEQCAPVKNSSVSHVKIWAPGWLAEFPDARNHLKPTVIAAGLAAAVAARLKGYKPDQPLPIVDALIETATAVAGANRQVRIINPAAAYGRLFPAQ
jgi:hypothetical protein